MLRAAELIGCSECGIGTRTTAGSPNTVRPGYGASRCQSTIWASSAKNVVAGATASGSRNARGLGPPSSTRPFIAIVPPSGAQTPGQSPQSGPAGVTTVGEPARACTVMRLPVSCQTDAAMRVPSGDTDGQNVWTDPAVSIRSCDPSRSTIQIVNSPAAVPKTIDRPS